MHVVVEGPPGGVPLVLLHSLGTTHAVWDATAAALQGGFRVIRPDLRGHGLSDVPPGPYSILAMAGDVLAVMDALGVARAHVAGLSIGGMVAQAMAAVTPDRVDRLVLCDTALAIPPAELWAERAAAVRASGMASIADAVVARWVTPAFALEPAALGLRQMLLRTDPEGYAGAAEAIASADLSGPTAGLPQKTLVLVGREDLATPVASAEALAAAIPGARLVVVEDAAHLAPVQQPEVVTAEIRAFLAPEIGDTYEAGMAVRRRAAGDAYVERALAGTTEFDRAFQHFIVRTAWGGVWTGPALDLRTRSLLTLTLLAALGHQEEFKMHVRCTRNTGASQTDIAEAMMHVAAYAGIPAANAATRWAKQVFAEDG
jgi:3-oxoadipate enol-lactonase / 4-carboxymuconolactone decarboxylase